VRSIRPSGSKIAADARVVAGRFKGPWCRSVPGCAAGTESALMDWLVMDWLVMDWLVMDWLGHGLAWSWTGGRGLAVVDWRSWTGGRGLAVVDWRSWLPVTAWWDWRNGPAADVC
jgi:hypothetical protein